MESELNLLRYLENLCLIQDFMVTKIKNANKKRKLLIIIKKNKT